MKVACIYARVSDDKLKEDGERRQDVQRQIDSLLPIAQAWVKAENSKLKDKGLPPEWNENVLVFKDDALSAFKEDWNSRPDFVRLIREAQANRLHRCWIESLDRWSRRVEDGLHTLRMASIQGSLTVTSTLEGEASLTTAQGWFRTTFGFVMAEWASRDKAEKTKSGMERRRNDKRKICQSCGIVHLGRHPATCDCPKCRKKKGRVESLEAGKGAAQG